MTPLDRYTCEQAFRMLDAFLDGALNPEELRLVEEHLERCAACAGEYRFETRLIDGIRDKLARVDLPPDLMQKISRALSRDP